MNEDYLISRFRKAIEEILNNEEFYERDYVVTKESIKKCFNENFDALYEEQTQDKYYKDIEEVMDTYLDDNIKYWNEKYKLSFDLIKDVMTKHLNVMIECSKREKGVDDTEKN